MVNTIKIYNPKDKPYGVLSNNAVSQFTIGDKRYRSVSNFIWSNMYPVQGIIKNVLANNNPNDVKKDYELEIEKHRVNIIQKALETSINDRINSNKELENLLVSTGNSKIKYVHNNNLYGVGRDNKGRNLVGEYLMQTRKNIITGHQRKHQLSLKEKKENDIYNTYLAYNGLTNIMRSGKDITEFISKTPEEIIEAMGYYEDRTIIDDQGKPKQTRVWVDGRSKLVKDAPSRDVVLDLITKSKGNPFDDEILLAVNNPTRLVQIIRKKNISNLRVFLLRKRLNLVLNMFADYMLSKKYPDLPPSKYEQARKEQFDEAGWREVDKMKNKIYDLYLEGMLSETLSDSIQEKIDELNIPSEQDVHLVESTDLYLIAGGEKEIGKNEPYIPPSDEFIYVHPFPQDGQDNTYQHLSPIDPTFLYMVNGRIYPTIDHYILTSLMAIIPDIGSIEKAYPYNLDETVKGPVKDLSNFVRPDVVNERYTKEFNNSYVNRLQKYAKEGLDTKFNDKQFQDVLLWTINDILLWDDRSDPILGTGSDGKGMNFVGKHLTQLRTIISDTRKSEKIPKMKLKEAISGIENDKFLKDWIIMRIVDMCKVINLVSTYHSPGKEINTTMAENILDKVYLPCGKLYGAAQEIKVDTPKYVRTTVKNCHGFSNAGVSLVEVLWKRIAVMVVYLYAFSSDHNIESMKTSLASIENMVSQNNSCVKIVEDKYDNCTWSAIINLLTGIYRFNSRKKIIGKPEVELSVNIILGKHAQPPLKQRTSPKLPAWIGAMPPSDLAENKKGVKELGLDGELYESQKDAGMGKYVEEQKINDPEIGKYIKSEQDDKKRFEDEKKNAKQLKIKPKMINTKFTPVTGKFDSYKKYMKEKLKNIQDYKKSDESIIVLPRDAFTFFAEYNYESVKKDLPLSEATHENIMKILKEKWNNLQQDAMLSIIPKWTKLSDSEKEKFESWSWVEIEGNPLENPKDYQQQKQRGIDGKMYISTKDAGMGTFLEEMRSKNPTLDERRLKIASENKWLDMTAKEREPFETWSWELLDNVTPIKLDGDTEYDEGDVDIFDDEFEDDEFGDELEDDDDNSQQQDVDYGDGGDDDFDDEYSPSGPTEHNIQLYMILNGMGVKDHDTFIGYMVSGIKTIKDSTISKHIKNNRINFFATQI